MRLLQPLDYQAAITSRFVLARTQIHRLLPHAVVEHVGSSAIPGAVSKGDLDICVLVAKSDHQPSVRTLTDWGYTEKLDTLRNEQLCMLEWHKPNEEHAVQLVAHGSPFEMFITFRDALLTCPALVDEYNQVKLNAAHLSATEYRAAKSTFIERVLRETKKQ
ncbi:MAG: hypothetical protein A2711_08160 [Burkholderiales bacterium RIFCSPHIGHO2_01_FULL_63_240]|jgi:GrpB-like predicted nucleotidyltransferase (UPF0157 family)|nr:MAG: hypothetical protein A2711_08160 [Burkholderiales bacterium RIFCSPHIGHO2_01_FULL_63_240]